MSLVAIFSSDLTNLFLQIKTKKFTDNLRAGVVMMLMLVWFVIISIVQDYVWLLLGVPEPKVVEATKKPDVEQTEPTDSNTEDENVAKDGKEDEKSTAIEVTAVADDGDDI
jgi:hypothetical protein